MIQDHRMSSLLSKWIQAILQRRRPAIARIRNRAAPYDHGRLYRFICEFTNREQGQKLRALALRSTSPERKCTYCVPVMINPTLGFVLYQARTVNFVPESNQVDVSKGSQLGCFPRISIYHIPGDPPDNIGAGK